MSTPTTETITRRVHLMQCSRRSCGYILTDDERAWKQDPEWDATKTAVCPICNNDSFYTLNEKGQQLTWKQRDEYRDGIDPHTIEPSPRMGIKNRTYILDAKRRALANE